MTSNTPEALPFEQAPRILCQPGAGLSCGSCCGMYNNKVHAHAELLPALATRTTQLYAQTDIQDQASLRAFRQRHEPKPHEKLLDGLPSCPFLGLLDLPAEPTPEQLTLDALSQHRVGCLIHPTRHNGLDQRDCGVYDRFTCEDYLCAAHSLLKAHERLLVLNSVKDSYLYGLVITDVRFVRALLELTADINASAPTPKQLQRATVCQAAAEYFELKRSWPYRAFDGILGAVIPLQGLETKRRPTPAERLNLSPHPADAILACLGSELDDAPALSHARALVMAPIQRFADAIAQLT